MTVIVGYNDQTGSTPATADPSWGSECFVHTDRTYVAVSGAVVTKVWVYGSGSGVFRVAFYPVVSGVPTTRISQPVVVPVSSTVGWYSKDCKVPLSSVGTQYGAAMEFFVDVACVFYYKTGPGGTQMISESRQWLPATWTNNGSDSNVIVFYAEVTEGGVSTAGGTDTWTLVASLAQGSPDTNAFTTAAINTTGANLLVVNVADGGASTLTDSKSNTWVLSTVIPYNDSSDTDRLYYCANPTVGTGHTFSSSGNSATLSIAAFSGASASPLDVAGGEVASFASSVKPGAVITPETNMLLVTGVMNNSETLTPTIDAGFTIAGQQLQVSGAHFGGGLAYKVVATPSSNDPTWTNGAFSPTSIASFKAGTTVTVTTYTDDFNRANGAPGANWSGSEFTISSNHLTTSANPGFTEFVPDLGSSDHYVEATVSDTSIGSAYIVVHARSSSAGANCYMGFMSAGSACYTIGKNVGGSYSDVATSASEPGHPASIRLRLEVEGTTIRLYGDGVLKVTTTDTTHTTGTKVGLNSTDGGTYDDFATGLLTAGAAYADTPPVIVGQDAATIRSHYW